MIRRPRGTVRLALRPRPTRIRGSRPGALVLVVVWAGHTVYRDIIQDRVERMMLARQRAFRPMFPHPVNVPRTSGRMASMMVPGPGIEYPLGDFFTHSRNGCQTLWDCSRSSPWEAC